MIIFHFCDFFGGGGEILLLLFFFFFIAFNATYDLMLNKETTWPVSNTGINLFSTLIVEWNQISCTPVYDQSKYLRYSIYFSNLKTH